MKKKKNKITKKVRAATHDIYAKFNNNPVKHTVAGRLSGNTPARAVPIINLDLDKDGHPVGVEVIGIIGLTIDGIKIK